MIKKVVVTDFKENGQLSVRMTMSLRKGLDGPDFEARKLAVAQAIQMHVLKNKKFVVEWNHDGSPEGYIVTR